MPDEKFHFEFWIEPPLSKIQNITRNNPKLVETSKNAHNITINWRSSLYQSDLILDCITNVVMWQNITGELKSKYVTK